MGMVKLVNAMQPTRLRALEASISETNINREPSRYVRE